jgi:chromosome segregation ATPase
MAFPFKNPLHYPLAVLAGGIVLVLGVRLVRLPSFVAVPAALAVAVGSTAVRKDSEPGAAIELEDPQLGAEINILYGKAQNLANQALALRDEATKRLTGAAEMELMGAVQYACDRTQELPTKIQQLGQRLGGGKSLLSAADLTQQISDAKAKRDSSMGAAKAQWQTLIESLEHNLTLAQEGEDTRQAQLVSLSTLISNAAGTLQQLQNKLQTADLSSSSETNELMALSDEFSSFQKNVELLVA